MLDRDPSPGNPPSGPMAGTAVAAWDRLEAWCLRYYPRLLDALNPGATEEEIDAVEQAIGQPLPADVRESLSIHNGQPGWASSGFLFGLNLLSSTAMVIDWQGWRDLEEYNENFRDSMTSFPERAIALDYANPGWIALTCDPGGVNLGVDLAPGPAGSVGQVINFGKHEDKKCVLASSWAEFLTGFAVFLESGSLDGIDLDHDDWFYIVQTGMGDVRHPHDMLVEWRRAGRWTPR